MAITKKIRFEVFKRDGFQCAYCGKTPPEVVLEVDHIEPVSGGGTDDMENLITACFDCNRGKTNIKLDKVPTKLSENMEVLREKEEQYKEYRKLLKKINERLNKECGKLEDIYFDQFEGHIFTNRFVETSVKRFLKLLPFYEVEEAMYLACGKFAKNDYDKVDSCLRYFCGICWNKIKGTKPPFREDK